MSIPKLHKITIYILLITAICYLEGFAVPNTQQTVYPSSCPDSIPDFHFLGTYNDHNYFLSETSATWLNASDIANSLGGYLTTITDSDENDFLADQLLPYQEIAFIGLTDYQTEPNFVWANGEPLLFLNLAGNNGLAQDFANISPWDGKWYLDSEFNSRKYIVEISCEEIDQQAELLITNVDCPIQFPFANNQLTYDVTIQNIDTIPSKPSKFGVYQDISNSLVTVADHLCGNTMLHPLAPGELTTISIVATINDPFYFPGFFLGDYQWNEFYVKQFNNPAGISLELNQDAYPVDVYCKKYEADVSIDLTTGSIYYGDSSYFQYNVIITNNGPDVAYNLKAELAKEVFGNIPAITPNYNILTLGDASKTRIFCLDSLTVGQTIQFNVHNDFDNNTNYIGDPPAFYNAYVEVYSEHLIDDNSTNNSIEQLFTYDPAFSDDCPLSVAGYSILGQYNQNRYFLSDTTVTWAEAKILAEQENGYLACLETLAESEFVMNLIDQNAFIGMSDHEAEGEMIWVNGESVDYYNIQNQNGPNLDYGSINFWDGLWILNKPVAKMKFILEIPCSFAPGTFPDLNGTMLETIRYDSMTNMIVPVDTLSDGSFVMEQESGYGYTFFLQNQGTQDAANDYWVSAYLSSDDSLSINDHFVGEFETGFTGKNVVDTVTVLSGISVPWDLLLDKYHLIISIDSEQEIEELDETNNYIVLDQMINVVGNLCTIDPVVEDSELTVHGIPQGNTEFMLYGPSWDLQYHFTCSSNCPPTLSLSDIADGDYHAFIILYDEDWDVKKCSMRVDFQVILGNGLITNQDPEANQFFIESDNHSKLPAILDQTLFPNPAHNILYSNIISTVDADDLRLEIYDVNNRLIISKNVSVYDGLQTLEIDISTLTNGVHQIMIYDNQTVLSSGRFVKF